MINILSKSVVRNLNAVQSPEATVSSERTAPSEVILSPEVRIEALEKEAIPTISPQVIAPFLNKPLLINASIG